MSLFHFLLDVVAVLLWLQWRVSKLTSTPRPLQLLAHLRNIGPRPAQAWLYLCGLALLLGLRALFYWHLGQAVNWTPILSLGDISLPFRSDYFVRMACYSFVSFAFALGTFYLWLLMLDLVNRKPPDPNLWHRAIRQQLGWVAKWPAALKLFLPWILGGLFWVTLSRLLVWLDIMPAPKSVAHLCQQALTFGLGTYLVCKYLIVAALLLYLLNSYIYLGDSAFWPFVNTTATNLLRPLAWLPLRAGKVDFAPSVGIILVWLLAEWAMTGLVRLYQRLPI